LVFANLDNSLILPCFKQILVQLLVFTLYVEPYSRLIRFLPFSSLNITTAVFISQITGDLLATITAFSG
jgi:hypothetical protein